MTRQPRIILQGDVAERLGDLPDASVDMIFTSPPYFRLRDYAVAGQLGLETHVDDWVRALARLGSDLRRVLVPTGTLWLNLGDSYAVRPSDGAPRKSLLLGPERLALRLLDDGWMLRNKLVWHKSNAMPIPVRDRLACRWETVYVFARQPHYFFDLDAIREPHRSQPRRSRSTTPTTARQRGRGPNSVGTTGLAALKADGRAGHPLGKNPGDVWQLASSNYRGPHPAMFPIALAERAIRAGCPERRCQVCRTPWRRAVIRAVGGTATRATLNPGCRCDGPSEPGVVLDPFMGAGTTAVAAERLDRDWLGIELNGDYIALAQQRLAEARASPAAA